MVRKRQFRSVDLDDDDEDLEVDDSFVNSEEVSESEIGDKKDQIMSEDEISTDSEDSNSALYLQYVKQRKKLKKLEAKMSVSLKHKDKKCKSNKKQKDVFTRFSVTYFSNVINALTVERKKVIEAYGFGSLLQFDRCYVPNKFAQWVAHQIDYKTGDIVVKPSIIPFTRDSVHYVLGLPLGSIPFPKDYSVGKSALLSKFNLHSVPSVKFFGNKLLNKEEQLSDEDVFICFILVALNCFLCPNTSLAPASKYLGIFDNLEDVAELDWSQFILDWSLDAVRTFNKGKTNKEKDPTTLGGCLYLLAVYYLDFVDFGHRQVAPGLPRILVWKDTMIKEYSDLDEITPGVFGYRPVMDISRTCYSKQAVFLYKNPSYSSLDSDFLHKLDENSRCILPEDLKVQICNLLEEHSLKSALTFSMQITSLSSLSDELKKSFATLLEHAYSVDSRAQKMILKLLKLLTEYEPKQSNEKVDDSPVNSQHLSTGSVQRSQKPVVQDVQDNQNVSPEFAQRQSANQLNCNSSPVHNTVLVDNKNSLTMDVDANDSHVPSAQKSCLKRPSVYKTPPDIGVAQSEPNTSRSSARKVSNVPVDQVLTKLSQHGNVHLKTPVNQDNCNPVPPFSSSPAGITPIGNKKHKSKIDLIRNYETATEIASLRNSFNDNEAPYAEVSLPSKKSVKFVRDNGERDVIYLDDPNEYVPQFGSPVSPKCASKYVFNKRSPSVQNDLETSTPQTPMTMVTIEDSLISNGRVTPLLSQSNLFQSLKTVPVKSRTPVKDAHKESPDCEIIGKRDVFDKAKEMNKKCEAVYNSKLKIDQPNSSKSVHISAETSSKKHPHDDFDNIQDEEDVPEFKCRTSSTGGKMPHYGPRRPIYPTNPPPNYVINGRSRIRLSDSEMKNYRAIMKLGDSEHQDTFAVLIGGVKCTYRSLCDSFKQSGFVNSFVINVFCRLLFMKPNGHPDVSKKHFFFSTIGDNFLKHPNDACQDVLQRAFSRSRQARPLPESNLLFFPTLFEDHWFVFVVDIKDRYFVFLDSFYNKDDQYQQYVRERLIPSFPFHWDKYVPGHQDMKFDQYRVIYPVVPRQPEENLVDSGIIVLMILQHWNSPRTVLTSVFDIDDIPKLRVKFANEILFFPQNNGQKRHVIEYAEKEHEE